MGKDRIDKLESCLNKALVLLAMVDFTKTKICPHDLGMPEVVSCNPMNCNKCFDITLKFLGEQDDNEVICLSCKESVSKEEAVYVEDIKMGWLCDGCMENKYER